jgi:ubiquinone/menaquinone biosynthesis C-methylase UbiE
MIDAFMKFCEERPGQTVLEVGIVPARGTERAFEARGTLAERTAVVSCTIASPTLQRPASATAASRLKQLLDSRHLPFADGEFDWVYCSEVIEHAGSFERQYELLKELLRISRKGIFVTTPNRWHPVEFNTRLPLLHWLPAAWWRRILKWSGKGIWASESVLNLLDAHELKNLTALLPCSPRYEIGHLRVAGAKAHFFLQIRKRV